MLVSNYLMQNHRFTGLLTLLMYAICIVRIAIGGWTERMKTMRWVQKNGEQHSPEAIEQWNEAMISRHPDTAAKRARFLHFLKEAGGDGRKDIRTYFDLIEFDEGRLK